MATYFLLTGVHVIHVLGGAIAVAWLAAGSGAASSPAGAAVVTNRMNGLLLYWYFVDLVWLTIVALLYVV